MRHTLDKELGGHAMVFSGPIDLVREAAKVQKVIETGLKAHLAAGKPSWKFDKYNVEVSPNVNYPGRKAKTWEDIEGFLKTPWPQAVKMIGLVVAEILKEKLPTPKSVRRRAKWDENDGDLDVDRVLHGEPDYMRRHVREQMTGPTSVTLICNLDTFTQGNNLGMYWRSATAIAACDVLEQLGYSTELWMWCKGQFVFDDPYHQQFTACRIKEAGAPVDLDATCDSLSHWFTVKGIFATFAILPEARSIGGADDELGKWEKYLDTEAAMKVYVPLVLNRAGAIEAAKDVLRWVKLGGQNSADDKLPPPDDE